jgi:hypothetical protein
MADSASFQKSSFSTFNSIYIALSLLSFAVFYLLYELNQRDAYNRLSAHWSTSQSPAMSNLTLCATAVFSKLAASCDDVVWLMPFLCGSTRNKMKHSAVYVTMFILETIACAELTRVIAYIVNLILPEAAARQGWTLAHVMQAASGSLLAMYAIKLFVEQWSEDDSDDVDTDGKEDVMKTTDDESHGEARGSVTTGDEAHGEKHGSVKKLIVIGILGSLDDMCIQSSLLMAGTLQMWHMLIGVTVGCCIVVAVCWGASSVSSLIRIVERVPLWAIVACLTLYTFLCVIFDW